MTFLKLENLRSTHNHLNTTFMFNKSTRLYLGGGRVVEREGQMPQPRHPQTYSASIFGFAFFSKKVQFRGSQTTIATDRLRPSKICSFFCVYFIRNYFIFFFYYYQTISNMLINILITSESCREESQYVRGKISYINNVDLKAQFIFFKRLENLVNYKISWKNIRGVCMDGASGLRLCLYDLNFWYRISQQKSSELRV